MLDLSKSYYYEKKNIQIAQVSGFTECRIHNDYKHCVKLGLLHKSMYIVIYFATFYGVAVLELV